MDHLLHNIQDITQRIASAARQSGRNASEIILVAVSKTVGLEEVGQAITCGISDFGENRSRELARKQAHYPGARWHMIGQLQTNKVKEVVGRTALIHSLDRWSLAEALDREGARQSVRVDALLEVNVASEEQKAGLGIGEVRTFLEAARRLPNLRIKGLMTMAPMSDNPEDSRPIFRTLHNLFTSCQQNPPGGNVQMQYLSMGMSQDFEVAVEEGANIVRVGTAIFAK